MSLVLAAIVMGAGALMSGGTWAWFRRRPKTKPPPTEPAEAEVPKPNALSPHGFGVELGDVIEVGGRELWLEQGWLLSEGDAPVVALFVAREATLVALPPPSRSLYLLDAVDLVVVGEPPLTLESRGVRFERVRRLPVRVEPLDKTPPLPWEQALLSEYRGLAEDALFVLGNSGGVRAWQGRITSESGNRALGWRQEHARMMNRSSHPAQPSDHRFEA